MTVLHHNVKMKEAMKCLRVTRVIAMSDRTVPAVEVRLRVLDRGWWGYHVTLSQARTQKGDGNGATAPTISDP